MIFLTLDFQLEASSSVNLRKMIKLAFVAAMMGVATGLDRLEKSIDSVIIDTLYLAPG